MLNLINGLCNQVHNSNSISNVGERLTLQNCNIKSFENGCKKIGIPDSNVLKVAVFERGDVCSLLHNN